MIYEVRTYTLKPGTVAEFETRFAARHPYREKYSKLGAFWHTEMGPLNQLVHVWPYDDLQQRAAAREAANRDPDLQRTPTGRDFIIAQQSEIMLPAPFMRPLGSQSFGTGNIYEMRIYTYQPGSLSEVLKRWAEAIPYREKYSPLAACWTSELGELNKFVHVWVYKDFNERNRIRAESFKDPHWPPQTREWLVRQENKLLLPAAFSPLQ
jgi:hypothetical protein